MEDDQFPPRRSDCVQHAAEGLMGVVTLQDREYTKNKVKNRIDQASQKDRITQKTTSDKFLMLKSYKKTDTAHNILNWVWSGTLVRRTTVQ